MARKKWPIPSPGMGFIYALTDPSNPSVPKYIGKTIALRRRFSGHRSWIKKFPDHPVSVWWNSLAVNGKEPALYILEQAKFAVLKERKARWIRFFRPLQIAAWVASGVVAKTIARNKLGWSSRTREIRRNSEAVRNAVEKLRQRNQAMRKPVVSDTG